MTIFDLKIGDKLRVTGAKKFKFKDDILIITNIREETGNFEYNSLWIHHENYSFSGGGFRITDIKNNNGYVLGTDIELVNYIAEDYSFILKILKKYGIN